MKIQPEVLINHFVRTYTDVFSLADFMEFVRECGIRATEAECVDYLETNPNIFVLKDGRYATRAAAFTQRYFSIKPGRKELMNRTLIVGHRCMPFVDPEILPLGINFYYKNNLLELTETEFDSATVLDAYTLYGDEYSSQYIVSDPANSGIDLGKTDFVLPPTVKVTGPSLAPLIADGFCYGDRILARVTDWDSSAVQVEFIHREGAGLQMTMEDVQRAEWYSALDRELNASFDILGPLGSIEDQLAMVFANNLNMLCHKNCGSIEEFFEHSANVGFELFGVETRLWHKGQEVPAIGTWNSAAVESAGRSSSAGNQEQERGALPEDADEAFCEYLNALVDEPEDDSAEPLPEYVMSAFIKDSLFYSNEDYEEILKKLHPNFHRFSKFHKKIMLLHLKNRHDILAARYNRFADSVIGELRHKALDLFSQVNMLVYSIDMVRTDLSKFPQQSLVILSQIFGHILHILEVTETDVASVIKEKNEILLSMEGMEFNFECVNEDLRAVLEKESKNGFSVLK